MMHKQRGGRRREGGADFCIPAGLLLYRASCTLVMVLIQPAKCWVQAVVCVCHRRTREECC